MTKRRVLFVDDDVQVLNGLKLMMRKQRHAWEMVFVGNAEAALAELQQAPFDTVVSDMRMPFIDGAELLKRVREKWPEIARVLLSGNTSSEGMERAFEVAQLRLTKPCDFTTLFEAIEKPPPDAAVDPTNK